MEQIYKVLFFKYLYFLLLIDKEENNLMLNKIGYISDEDNMNDIEKQYRHISRYFYLLNEANISNLSEIELRYLKTLNENSKLDDFLIIFFQKTYSKVLLNNDDMYYGPHGDNYLCHANSIGLGFKFEEFGFSNSQLFELDDIEKNDVIIANMINNIKMQAEKNKIKIDIIKYNELYEVLDNEEITM